MIIFGYLPVSVSQPTPEVCHCGAARERSRAYGLSGWSGESLEVPTGNAARQIQPGRHKGGKGGPSFKSTPWPFQSLGTHGPPTWRGRGLRRESRCSPPETHPQRQLKATPGEGSAGQKVSGRPRPAVRQTGSRPGYPPALDSDQGRSPANDCCPTMQASRTSKGR